MAGRRVLQVLLMLAGLLAWAAQFTIIYGVTSTLCARGWADLTLLGVGVVPATILLATVLALAATAAVLFLSIRSRRQSKAGPSRGADAFMIHATFLISGLSLVAIAWHGLPALILPACA